MPVYVEEVQSEINVQEPAEPQQQQGDAAQVWEQLVLFRALQQRVLLDQARTSAFGNED
jgi:hypothetical protein